MDPMHTYEDLADRFSAAFAAVAGLDVVDKRYRKVHIRIAFNPVTEEFATWTAASRVWTGAPRWPMGWASPGRRR